MVLMQTHLSGIPSPQRYTAQVSAAQATAAVLGVVVRRLEVAAPCMGPGTDLIGTVRE